MLVSRARDDSENVEGYDDAKQDYPVQRTGYVDTGAGYHDNIGCDVKERECHGEVKSSDAPPQHNRGLCLHSDVVLGGQGEDSQLFDIFTCSYDTWRAVLAGLEEAPHA